VNQQAAEGSYDKQSKKQLPFKGPFFKGRKNEGIDKALAQTDSDDTVRGKKKRKRQIIK
jgi:hypothetical protein